MYFYQPILTLWSLVDSEILRSYIQTAGTYMKQTLPATGFPVLSISGLISGPFSVDFMHDIMLRHVPNISI
jgi:hypothetical protein